MIEPCKPNIALRAARACSDGTAAAWRWFWQDRKSFMGYLCGSCVVVNIAVAARIFTMTEASFAQVPLILGALAAFDGTIFGINAIHSVSKSRGATAGPAPAGDPKP